MKDKTILRLTTLISYTILMIIGICFVAFKDITTEIFTLYTGTTLGVCSYVFNKANKLDEQK